MQIEVLTEKLTNGKQSAFIDYGEEAISVDIGDGRDMQRVHYRVADIEKLPKEQRKHYRKMKRLYALKQLERHEKMTAAEHEAAMKERVRKRFEEAQKNLNKKEV
nr:hypothetical protein [uncultured Dysosmobacter sp.]